MKKLIAIVFFAFGSLTILAQEKILIQTNDIIAGRIDRINKDINAKEYIFPERIEDSFIDTTTNFITIQLRGLSKNGKWLNNSGNVILYDLSAKQEKWVKKINYQQSRIKQFDNVMIETVGEKSYCLNSESGENLWEVKNAINYVNPKQKIGIGYKYKTMTGYSNNLEGIDLKSGNPLWKREINREYSWNDILSLNDSVILIAAAGLHSLNLKNGNGWDYNAITGDKDYKETIAANAIGAALGVLTGTLVMTTGYNLVRDIVSNILVDSPNIYFASKEKITCLDDNGQIIWTFPFAKNLASKSAIFIKDSTLCMINYGYAFMGNRQVKYGTPFIASFSRKTGKQLFLSEINGTKDQIIGYKFDKDDVFLVFKDRVAKYSLIDGKVLLEKSVDIATNGELRYFVGSRTYIKTDSLYQSIDVSNKTSHFLYTKSGKILVMNEDLNVTDQVDYEQFYTYYLKTKNYKFLSKGNKTIVIDNKNKKIGDLKVSGRAILIGSKLYDIQENSFLELDISELIK